MEQYDSPDELCPNCQTTLLVRTPDTDEPWCPYCEDWRGKLSGATSARES